MQNNLDTNIREIRFERIGEELSIIFKEREEEYRIAVGLYGYRENILNFRGEKYIVKAIASAQVNADGEGEYRIEFLYPEMPNTRMLRITRISDSAIKLSFSEMPNNKIIDGILQKATSESVALGFVMDLFEKRMGEGVVEKKVEKTFSPTLVGADINYEGYQRIVDEENAKAAYESFSVKILRSIVDKFFKEDKPDKKDTVGSGSSGSAEPQKEEKKSFIGSIMGKIIPGKK